MIDSIVLLAVATATNAVTLDNGLRLRTLPVPGDVVSVALVLEGGTSLDGHAEGESLLAHQLLFGQGDDVLREEFKKQLVEQGAEMDLDVRPDRVVVRITALATQLDAIVGLLELVTVPAQIEGPEFQRARNAIVDSLWERRRSSERRALAQLPTEMFGHAHPYGHVSTGNRRTLGRASVKNVRAHLTRTLCPHRAELTIAGDVDPKRVTALAQEYLGDWKKCRKPAVDADVSFTPRRRTSVHLIHDGLRSQVIIVGGLAIPLEREEDGPALEIAGDILGGSLSSRLQANLRQDGGLTYGAQAAVDRMRGAGVVYVHTPVDPQRVDEALRALLATFDALASSPFSDDEIARARRRRVSMRASAARSANDRIARWLRGSDDAEPSDADVRRVAARLKSESLQLVIVGNGRKLEPDLKALDLGQVRFVR